MKLGDKGALLNDDGTPYEIDGVAQFVSNPGVGQDTVDRTVQQRLDREKKAAEKNRNELIAAHEAELRGSISPERAAELNKRIASLEEETMSSGEVSRKRQKEMEEAHGAKIGEMAKANTHAMGMYKTEVVKNAVLNAAGAARFMSPEDAFDTISKWVQWEEESDAEGKLTGNHLHSFVTMVQGEDDKPPEQTTFDAAGAVAHLAKLKPYLVQTKSKGGAPPQDGTNYGRPPAGSPNALPMKSRMASGYSS